MSGYINWTRSEMVASLEYYKEKCRNDDHKIALLRSSIAGLRVQMNSSTEKKLCEEYSNKLKDVRNKVKFTNEKLVKLEKEGTKLSKQKNKYKKEAKHMRGELNDVKNWNAKLKDENGDLKSTISSMEIMLRMLRKWKKRRMEINLSCKKRHGRKRRKRPVSSKPFETISSLTVTPNLTPLNSRTPSPRSPRESRRKLKPILKKNRPSSAFVKLGEKPYGNKSSNYGSFLSIYPPGDLEENLEDGFHDSLRIRSLTSTPLKKKRLKRFSEWDMI